MSEDDRKLESWLRRMKWALASLPAAECDDIVAETRAHLCDRVAQGTALNAALAEFETPESYARRFVDERELSGLIASQKSAPMLGAIVRRAHRSVVAAVAFLVVFALGSLALVATLTAIVKIEDPVHAGLWWGSNQFFLGIITNPGASREMLGNWIFVLAALSVASAWLSARWMLVWAVQRLARTN